MDTPTDNQITELVAEGTAIGRPSLFRHEFCDQAYKLCLLGALDRDLADFFEVSETTINNWKLAYPSFTDSLRKGKKIADAEVAHSLFERATGAEWVEEQAFKLKTEFFDDNGKKIRTEERIETVEVRKAAAPETAAVAFFLKNRDPKRWREKQELQHTGKDGEALPEAQVLAGMSGEMLIELLALNGKLASSAEDGAEQSGDITP